MAGKKIHDNETKTHLIQCAKKEFMDKGFAGASLRGICQKAGVTTGALYFFFQDKDDLFCEVVGNFMDRLNEILREHFSYEVNEMESGKATMMTAAILKQSRRSSMNCTLTGTRCFWC